MLLDTSAWLEFLDKTVLGYRVKEVVDKGSSKTMVTSLAEIAQQSLKRGLDAQLAVREISSISQIIHVNESISLLAGQICYSRKKANKRWGMMDSFVLAGSMLYKLKILTKDSDFADLENVEML